MRFKVAEVIVHLVNKGYLEEAILLAKQAISSNNLHTSGSKRLPKIPSRLISTSAEGWELYDKPGADVVAQKLNKELKGSLIHLGNGLKATYRPDPYYGDVSEKSMREMAEVVKEVSQKFNKVLKKYDEFGAQDRETRSYAKWALKKYAELVLSELSPFSSKISLKMNFEPLNAALSYLY